MILMSNWERGANDIKMRVEDETPCWVMDIILGGVSPKKRHTLFDGILVRGAYSIIQIST